MNRPWSLGGIARSVGLLAAVRRAQTFMLSTFLHFIMAFRFAVFSSDYSHSLRKGVEMTLRIHRFFPWRW